jgi:uncharacterized protein
MENIETAVNELLHANDGHGFDHVERVRTLALRFAEHEGADANVVELASLLHDVDDYKIFGQESSENLINATHILATNGIDKKTTRSVLNIIRTMGYNKYLEGIRPDTLEGMVVSDADMCEAIGAIGILRTHAYALSKGNDFFDKTLAPLDEELSAEEYRASRKSHSAQHFFDKLLRIPSLLSTESGMAEGNKRQAIMVEFLKELFEEENARDWAIYLDNFLKGSKLS